jgi:RNA polymerase sigma factor (sigma-70 family)
MMAMSARFAVPSLERIQLSDAGITKDSFERLVFQYNLDLLRLAYAMCGDRSLAEDAVQSCWQIAWRTRLRIRDPARVRGWLFTVTANEVRRQMRRRRLADVLHGRFVAPDSMEGLDPSSVDLAVALKALTMRDRQIVAMRYGLGLTSEEISRHFGLSASGTRRRLQAALAVLRDRMKEHPDV